KNLETQTVVLGHARDVDVVQPLQNRSRKFGLALRVCVRRVRQMPRRKAELDLQRDIFAEPVLPVGIGDVLHAFMSRSRATGEEEKQRENSFHGIERGS